MNALQQAEDFLKKDLQAVMKQYKCCWSCFCKMEIALANGDFEMVEAKMIDFRHSLAELKRLKERKQQYDRMEELVMELQSKGINVEKIARTASHLS